MGYEVAESFGVFYLQQKREAGLGLSYQMIVLRGDGIGPEITSEAVREVLATAAVSTNELTDAVLHQLQRLNDS